MSSEVINRIELQLQKYFDALYFSDVVRLKEVFHEDAVYICATERPMLKLTMAEYFPIVENRISPASKQQLRHDKITSIHLLNEMMAMVHVECAIEPKYFYDALTFVLVENEWKILSKVFHYEIMAQNNN